MLKPSKVKKKKSKKQQRAQRLESFLNKRTHKRFIQRPKKNEFECIELSEQYVRETHHDDLSIEVNIMPRVTKSKYIDKYNNNMVTYFYSFKKGTAPPDFTLEVDTNADDYDSDYDMKYLNDITTPKCKLAIIRSIPNNIGNIIRSKMKYMELNPLFNDYRYSRRSYEIIKKALILQKAEEEKKGIPKEYDDWTDHLRTYDYDELETFRNKQTSNVLEKRTLQKCIKYGANIDEFEKYLYSKNINKTQWLSLTNMVENDEIEFAKWKVRRHQIIDPSLNCSKNNDLWIPSLFQIDANYNTKIISDINNLSRLLFNDFYKIIEKIFTFMIPMFEYIIFNSSKTKKYSLRNKTVKVMVKSQIYELYPNEEYNGRLHKEGTDGQNIAAVGIYYFDKDKEIKDDIFELSKGFPYINHKLKYDINIDKNDCIVFNNKNGIQHSLRKLTTQKCAFDNYKIVKRKIIIFCLVDPLSENKNIKTSKNINVNKYDKYEFVVKHFFQKKRKKGKKGKKEKRNNKHLSKDIICLIVSYVYRMNLFKKRSKRNAARMQQSIPKSEGMQYYDD